MKKVIKYKLSSLNCVKQLAMFDNLEHEHIWDYFRVSTYKTRCVEELFVKKCSICEKKLKINEDEYLENCFLHIDDLYFSYN